MGELDNLVGVRRLSFFSSLVSIPASAGLLKGVCMNKSLGLLAAAMLGAAPAAFADDVLTGDTRLACEAGFVSVVRRPSERVCAVD